MFIRRYQNKLKDGSKVHGHNLLEGHRIGGKIKQISLLNLGKDFRVPREDWPRLTREVLCRLRGTPTVDQDDFLYRDIADDIAERLEASGYRVDQKPVDYLTVEPDFDHQSRSVGGERLCLKALEELGLMKVLDSLGFKPRAVKICTALIVARMLSPGSERHTHHWMKTHSAIWHLLGLDKKPPSQNTLHRHVDRLMAQKEAIMDGVYKGVRSHLGFSETICFYDLTNTYYTGRKKGDKLAYGHSKDKRYDCPLVSMALLMDASGFPRSVDFLQGNVSEPHTLKAAIEKLDAASPSVILDAGIATEANLSWLRSKKMDYICVQRSKAPAVPDRKADQEVITRSGQQARLWRLKEHEDELRLYVHSDARKAVADRFLEAGRKKFEAALKELNDNLKIPYRLKRYEKVVESVGRLKERYSQVASQYEVTVTRAPTGPNAVSVTFERKDRYDTASRSAGGYILRTSHKDWDLERIVNTYWQLTDIEDTFRTLKSDLGLRPIYHSKDERIDGHMFVSTLAYHGVQLMRTKFKKHKVHDNWGTLQKELLNWHRITTTFTEKTGDLLINAQDCRPNPKQRQLAEHLGLSCDKRQKQSRIPREDQAANRPLSKAA